MVYIQARIRDTRDLLLGLSRKVEAMTNFHEVSVHNQGALRQVLRELMTQCDRECLYE